MVALLLALACAAPAWALAAKRPSAAVQLAELEQLDRRLLANEQRMVAAEELWLSAGREQAYAKSMAALTGLRLRRATAQLRIRLGVLTRALALRQSKRHSSVATLGLWIDRERLWRSLAAHDLALVAAASREQDIVDGELARAVAAGRIHSSARVRARRLQASLAKERRRRSAALLALRQTRLPLGVAATWHAQGQEAVAATIGAATSPPDTAPKADIFAPGGLPWPATGRVRTRFGDRIEVQFGTLTRHHGLAIQAPLGSPVRSVLAGRVLFADWLSGFGRTVILEHEGAMQSVHGHLARIDVRRGQTVVAEQTLGEVGDTGSLRGTELYFELRQHGVAIDPLTRLAGQPNL